MINDLERVKKAIDFLIEQESLELKRIDETPTIRTLQSYTSERKHLVAGRIQGLCDASIIINKAILGETKLLDYKIGNR